MQVLYAYLNGDETLEAALTAWRTMPLIDSDDDEETVLDEAALFGIDRESLHAEHQARLAVLLERLDEAPDTV
jgi:hypothetical protein